MNPSPEAIAQDTASIQSEEKQQRYILAQIEQLTLAFELTLVAEIPIVERAQILALPFYPPAVIGVLHHAGRIVPLVSLRQVLGIPTGFVAERLTVVQLSAAAAEQAGLGLVVDRTMGLRSHSQLPPHLFSLAHRSEPNSEPNLRLFKPEILTHQLWQPLRWQSI
jgi:chemotaxis signal transduction protein